MRLLFVTYEFPPKGGPGIQRPVQTIRRLVELGWDVTVLTVKDPPALILDQGALGRLPESIKVERAWSLEPTRAVQAYRRLRGRGTESSSEQTSSTPERGYTSMPRGFIRFVQALFVPDEKALWAWWAVPLGKRLHGREPFDAIMASGPPFTAYRVAWRISRATGAPWVADIRDPIVGGYFFTPPTPIHEWLMKRYESRVVKTASRLLAATEGVRQGLLERNPRAAGLCIVVNNGFDPAEFDGPTPPPHEGMLVSYVGTFQASAMPDVFLEGLARATERRPALAQDIRVRFVGPRDAESERMLAESGLESLVVRTGFVSHEQAVTEMRQADVLLQVMGDDPKLRLALSGKLPEYLAAGKTVLSIVPEGVAADAVRRAGGYVVHPSDVDGVADALLELHELWQCADLPVPDPAVVRAYDRSAIVEDVSAVLMQVVDDAKTTRGRAFR